MTCRCLSLNNLLVCRCQQNRVVVWQGEWSVCSGNRTVTFVHILLSLAGQSVYWWYAGQTPSSRQWSKSPGSNSGRSVYLSTSNITSDPLFTFVVSDHFCFPSSSWCACLCLLCCIFVLFIVYFHQVSLTAHSLYWLSWLSHVFDQNVLHQFVVIFSCPWFSVGQANDQTRWMYWSVCSQLPWKKVPWHVSVSS